MGIIRDIAKRDLTGETRKEESCLLYSYDINVGIDIESGEYKNMRWAIGTCGECPYVCIDCPALPSVFAGMSQVCLPDRNKKMLNVSRMLLSISLCQSEVKFIYTYCHDGDYTMSKHSGHKYTLKELKDDIKSFIDYITEKETEFLKSE